MIGHLSAAAIAAQITALNSASQGMFVFNLAGINRRANDAWYSMKPMMGDERAAKSAMRKGTKSTLNIYTAAPLDSRGKSGILGWSTFPSSK